MNRKHEIPRIDLDGTVTANQLAVEKNAYLGHHRASFSILGRSNLYGCHQILFAVGSQFTDRQLATRQILQAWSDSQA